LRRYRGEGGKDLGQKEGGRENRTLEHEEASRRGQKGGKVKQENEPTITLEKTDFIGRTKSHGEWEEREEIGGFVEVLLRRKKVGQAET